MDESSDSLTELRRAVVVDGRTHALEVRSDEFRTQVELCITDAAGAIVGSMTGAVEANCLQAAADLVGSALTAAANAHANKGFDTRLRKQRVQEKHRNHGLRWRADEDRELAKRFNESASYAELADEFGRNENSIRARLVLLDLLPTDQWPTGARMPASLLERHNTKDRGKKRGG
jgi:hypothetical protein